MPMVMEMAGSSTRMSGRGRGSSGSTRDSPMVMSSIPATATMSPAWAASAGLRSRPSVTSSSETRALTMLPSWRAQPTDWPLRRVPLWMRSRARRPRKGEASRLVTWAWRGASSS